MTATPPPRPLVLGVCFISKLGGVSSLHTCLSLLFPVSHVSVIASTSSLLSFIKSTISSGLDSLTADLAFKYPIFEHLLTNGFLGSGRVGT